MSNDNLGVCGLCGRDPQKLELENERLKDAIVTWHAYHTHEAHVECGCAACYAIDLLAVKLSTEVVR